MDKKELKRKILSFIGSRDSLYFCLEVYNKDLEDMTYIINSKKYIASKMYDYMDKMDDNLVFLDNDKLEVVDAYGLATIGNRKFL